MVVCGQEFSEGFIARIQEKVEAEPQQSRLSLSRQVCTWLDWRSANGKLKEMSCRVALLKLHKRGLLRLPEPQSASMIRCKGERAAAIEVQVPPELHCDFSQLGEVEILLVKGRDSKTSRTWKALMHKYHYLGAGPLCGAQLRYLIRSPRYGWLGGLAFSAAAWKVRARDEWIGWQEDIRLRNLQKVVCNSRFLILPQVKALNLASHVLSLCAQRLADDWQQKYAIEPVLLETFVERDRFRGTCYRAANWKYVGSTCGRGRQDRQNEAGVSVKDVYLYPLRSDASPLLCEGAAKEVEIKTQREPGDWAEEEFGAVQLGDERLGKRLLALARDLYGKPQANIPQACGSKAKTKAAYRFFGNDGVSMDKILHPHYAATQGRIKEHKIVLAVQDTTSLNYSAHPATEGLGVIGSKVDKSIGLMVHDTLAFSVEGTPLGLLDVQCWIRKKEAFGKKHKRHELPIEQKESYKWLKSFYAASEAQKHCGSATIVSVGDREADIYELFKIALQDKASAKLLVRAEHERLFADGQGHLWERVAGEAVSGIQVIRVPRRGSRQAREARLEVRFSEVTLKPPQKKTALGEVTLWAVLAEEIKYAEGVEPLRWMLLSTLEVNSFEQATERLSWYATRWGIEVFHRTFKSGCKIEDRQLGSASSIEACLAIDMVVAWRVFYLTKLGRETPEVPCTVFFEDEEWKALYTFKTQNPVLPENPPTLREAMRMVATLGGFLGRKSDGEPGTQTLWLGLQRLDDITAMWKYMAELYVPHLLKPAVSRSPGYG